MIGKDELYDLYWNKKLSVRQIAKLLDVNESTVRRWMKKYGIPRRDYSTAGRIRREHYTAEPKDIEELAKQLVSEIAEQLEDRVEPSVYSYTPRDNLNIPLPASLLESKEPKEAVVTIVLSDLHLGHESHLPDTYWSCINNLKRVLSIIKMKAKILKCMLVLNGDIVSGRGIYRKHELENLIQRGHWQVFLAERVIKKTIETIEDEVHVDSIYLLKGHHEDTESNYMLYLKKALGNRAKYCSRHVVLDIGEPIGNYNVLFTHGYGKSQYYPVSYSLLRDLWKAVSEYRKRDIIIERVVVSHSHWLNPDLKLENISISVTGGFQRWQYTIEQRPSGLLVLLYSGGSCSVIPVTPSADVQFREVNEPNLEYKNMGYYAKMLREHFELYEEG